MRLAVFITAMASLLAPTGTFAQQAVSLGPCYGCVGDTLIAGQVHTLQIEIDNRGGPPDVRYNINNGFRLYSPNNAQWTELTLHPAGLGTYPPANFALFQPNCIGCNGQSPSLIQFGGVAFSCTSGLPPGYDGVAFTISFRSRPLDVGKQICIDSSYTPPAGSWLWASLCPPAPNLKPSWSGAHCYRVLAKDCFGMTGNIDCDQFDQVDISDLTRLVDYLFGSLEPLCLPKEGNTDGDPAGNVDIGDLTRLVDYLFISFAPLADCR